MTALLAVLLLSTTHYTVPRPSAPHKAPLGTPQNPVALCDIDLLFTQKRPFAGWGK